MKQLSKIIKLIAIKLEKKIFNFVLPLVFKRDITIISSNCIGTRIYQSAKKRYSSPTINLWMKPADFIKFTERLDFYLEQELIEYSDPQKNYPCGKLCDIKLFFQHYRTFDEAKSKWQERTKRTCTDNFLIIFTDRDGATIQDIKRIAEQKNAIVFCSSNKREYLKSVPNIVFIDGSEDQVGDLYSNYHQLLYRFPFKKVLNYEK
jgi:uncharacterized protein (DUF1919 family)